MNHDFTAPEVLQCHRNARTDNEASPYRAAFPKDAVLRASASETEAVRTEDKFGERAPAGEGKAGQQTALAVPDKATSKEAAAEARKLMLEDGVPERDTAARDAPDIGDMEI